MAIRATESLAVARAQRKRCTAVLVVRNDVFAPVTEHLSRLVNDEGADKFCSPEFSAGLRKRVKDLCFEVPDITVVLVFIYFGLPMFTLQILGLALYSFLSKQIKVFDV